MHRLCSVAALVLCWTLMGPVQAQISQLPLLAINGVAPNVVVTIDDSGSMMEECIPSDICPTKEAVYQNGNSKFITYDPGYLLARRARSSSMNLLYYNPQRRYQPWLKADGSRYENSNPSAARYDPSPNPTNRATLNLTTTITVSQSSFCTGSSCTISTETFDPAQYYVQRQNTVGNAIGDFDQFKINSGTYFTKYPDRTDCPGNTCTKTEELQNFANWFTYYRNKMLAAKAVIAETFSLIPPETRIGYGNLGQGLSNIDGEMTATLVRGVRAFTGMDKNDFYNWLFRLPVIGGTPLRGATKDVGSYYMRNDKAGPWAQVPGGTDTTPHAICRRALHLLITDGAWSGSTANNYSAELRDARLSSGAVRNANGLVDTNADSDQGRPFAGATANTLADVATYYWKTNLRSDISGSATAVPVNAQEAALGRTSTQPHMVNYMVSFGISGTLKNPDDVEALKNGSKSWPAPLSDTTGKYDPAKVDDLWHAAWNSGGLYLPAFDPKELGISLSNVLNSLNSSSSTGAKLLTNSRFVTSSFSYIPSYQPKDWAGDLQAYSVDTTTGGRGKLAWSAVTRLASANQSSRNIYTMNPSNGGALSFTYSALQNLNPSTLLNVPDSTPVEGLINYLRGDRSLEGKSYRTRSTVLGDIVNSAPLLVRDGEDSSYDFLPSPISNAPGTYRTFLQQKKKRQGQVFVGANDGMLHAFNAQTGDETFAYIPKTVLGSINQLSQPSYTHRYFVDGPLVEADVYDTRITPNDSDTGWRNLVIGTGGAGARNIFAINVPVKSNGNNNTAYAPGPTDILWEINNTDANFSDLGAVLQKPAVGMMRDGTWVVIVGNGYVDSNGTAKLYIINALTGRHIKTISIPGSGTNGLGGVRVVLDKQRQITAAYAGDLQGNLWKFDFSSTTPADWKLAFTDTPLYQAKNGSNQVEPITASPVYFAHPRGGNLVVFGTGKFFENKDLNDVQVRSLYGVWDKVLTGAGSAAPEGAIAASSTLVEQTLSSISGTSYYTASANAVDYADKRGWLIRLTMSPSGLRLVSEPQLAVGRVFLQALSPGIDAANPCATRQGKSVNFVLDPFTGTGSRTSPTFDFNGDGVIDTRDTFSGNTTINVVAVASSDTGGANFSQKVGTTRISAGVITDAAGQTTVAGSKNTLRRSWRQIINRPTP